MASAAIPAADPAPAAARRRVRPAAAARTVERPAVFTGSFLAWLLMSPQLVLLAWFFFWPTGQALYQAFTISDAFGGNVQLVWLENFTRLFASPEYRKAIGVTVVFSTAVTALSLGVALVLAVAVDRTVKATGAYRVLVIWPYAVAASVAAVIWTFLLDPTQGVLTLALERGLGIAWDPSLRAGDAMVLVVLAAAWKQVAYNFVFFAAGLTAIPRTIVEAAAIDGAGPLRRVRWIVLPLLSPTLFFLLTVNIVYAFFDTFPIIRVTTAGGPADATTTLVYKVYKDGFIGLDYGSSAAQSVILMAVVIGLTVIQFRWIERRVHYGS